MKRVVTLLIILLFAVYAPNAYAPNTSKHNKSIENLLFSAPSKLKKEEKEKLDLLENALALCIDQFKSNDSGYSFLNDKEIYGFPKTLAEINCPGGKYGHHSHRQFTHQGWNFDYSKDSIVTEADSKWAKEKWPKRKKILLATVEKVFNFNKFWPDAVDYHLGYNEKCESFSALLYYLHLLEDQSAMDSFSKYQESEGELMALAGYSNDTHAIIPEIQRHLIVLVEIKDYNYEKLMWLLDQRNRESAVFSNAHGIRISEDQFPLYKECVKNVLKDLDDYLDKILEKQPFFNEVFQ
ncbi:MAG: hypothetical protein IJ041_07930 [Clostridia bacterium]|nr:hypothetical protein [Clostridia bacterium]